MHLSSRFSSRSAKKIWNRTPIQGPVPHIHGGKECASAPATMTYGRQMTYPKMTEFCHDTGPPAAWLATIACQCMVCIMVPTNFCYLFVLFCSPPSAVLNPQRDRCPHKISHSMIYYERSTHASWPLVPLSIHWLLHYQPEILLVPSPTSGFAFSGAHPMLSFGVHRRCSTWSKAPQVISPRIRFTVGHPSAMITPLWVQFPSSTSIPPLFKDTRRPAPHSSTSSPLLVSPI
ncbi:hypothetical protein F5146DRAFT_659479 [Armillaria mellea]|nr:hypothetical protein F5146DRAFT_659479 [Armillaria mellea]